MQRACVCVFVLFCFWGFQHGGFEFLFDVGRKTQSISYVQARRLGMHDYFCSASVFGIADWLTGWWFGRLVPCVARETGETRR